MPRIRDDRFVDQTGADIAEGTRIRIHAPFFDPEESVEAVVKTVLGNTCLCTEGGNFMLCAFDLSARFEIISGVAVAA